MNTEEQIKANALRYQQNGIEKWEGTNPSKFDAFYQAIFQHCTSSLLPHLKTRAEKLVEYWPASFLWGTRSEYKRGFADDRAYLYKEGTFATGYFVVTDKSAYLVALRNMTDQFPRFATGTGGFALRVMKRMGGESDERRPIKEDKIWIIPYSTILAAEIGQDDERSEVLFIRTTLELWHIYDHFNGTLEMMNQAVTMGTSGKLAAIWTSPTTHQSQSPKAPSAEILEMLKKLGELKDAGVLTESEFEQKKKDLLSRL